MTWASATAGIADEIMMPNMRIFLLTYGMRISSAKVVGRHAKQVMMVWTNVLIGILASLGLSSTSIDDTCAGVAEAG